MTSMAIPGADSEGAGFADVGFPSLDGTPLRGRYWAHPDPRGVLVISHGLGEHGGSYRRTAGNLLELLPIDVLAFDYRGSGRSPGKRGVIRDYGDLTLDLDAAVRRVASDRPGLPRFVLGHSNGGLVALRTVLERDLGLSGLILSNPSIRVTAHIPAWKLALGEVLLRVAPWVTMKTGLESEQLTQDPGIMSEIDADPLRHSRISPPLFFGMRDSGRMVRDRASEIHVPTLMILGGADPITDPEACRRFFEALGAADKTLELYPEMRHEPLNEVGRSYVLADLANWLGPRLKPKDDR